MCHMYNMYKWLSEKKQKGPEWRSLVFAYPSTLNIGAPIGPARSIFDTWSVTPKIEYAQPIVALLFKVDG